jgi:hypothetical protein
MGPTAILDDVKKTKFFALRQLELRPLGRPVRSQGLYRLRYPGSYYIPHGLCICDTTLNSKQTNKQTNKLHGLSPRVNYTDRATSVCRRSDYQLLRIVGARGQRDGSLRPYFRFSRQKPLLVLKRLSGPRSRPTTFFLVVPGIEPGPPDL